MPNSPTATEETGHVWLHDGEQSVNLSAAVQSVLSLKLAEYDTFLTGTKERDIVQAILAIPQIRKALELYSRTVTPEGEIEGRKAF